MDTKFEKGAPLPKTIGACADLLHEVRTLRLAMQKETDAVKARETEITNYIVDTLSKSDDTGAAGLKYRAQVVTKVKPTVADWDALHAYILENGRFDLLQKRLSDKSVADMWDEGEAVPGVEKFNAIELSLKKL